jgi:hypothetical protein
MSTTSDEAVAESYATRDAKFSLLFKLNVLHAHGADISFASVFPTEKECASRRSSSPSDRA